MSRKALMGMILVALMSQTAWAGTTGVISGVVTDSGGTPIPGVTVTVTDEGLTMSRYDVTSEHGRYRIAQLPPDRYKLRAELMGMKTIEQPNLQVHANQELRLTLIMEVAAFEQTIRVTAQAPTVDVSSSTVGHSYGRERRRGTGRRSRRREVQVSPDGFQAEYARCITGSGMVAITPDTPGTEDYDHLPENPFLDARTNPLSTFSIDVDTASYSNVRRFLRSGRLPPPEAVRIEELVNYFSYDYPDPTGEHPFSAILGVSDCPWAPEHRLVQIGLQGRRVPTDELPPANLVFLLDVSGSMSSPTKLPLLKRSLELLVQELGSQDRVAMVVYAGAAGLVLPSTPGDDHETILDALDRLHAGGSTAGAAGIELAYRVALENFIEGGNNRVILATDGDFNVGITSDGGLVRLIEEKRKEGVFLTVLGYGMGNLKDSRMEKLADKGNGNYAYIDSLSEARKVLVEEMGALWTIAKDVKIQVEFNPVRVSSYRLIGYENRLLAKEDFDDDTKDAGEIGAGHSVTALYEVVPTETGEEEAPWAAELRYQESELSSEAFGGELLTLRLRYKQPDEETSRLLEAFVVDQSVPLRKTGDGFRFAAAVAEMGMLLRGSEHAGKASWKKAIKLAKGALGEDEFGRRAELVELAGLAADLAREEVR